jgi:hypothetical protein
MKWHKANKQQLLQIALKERCPVDFKYRACQELQMRWDDAMLTDLVVMYGQQKEAWEIAEYLGVTEKVVRYKIVHYKLSRGRVTA